ncbi:MAG: SpoIIE family protein phosphatase [Bacteroidia bacterium]|nr:SpoIIE family protein phosphatase [Bacteroidia bacterium]
MEIQIHPKKYSPDNDFIHHISHLITENRELRESLNYASSVQQGLMPQARHFNKLGQPYFVFYRPARIIGGDFFWLGKKNDWIIYAVGDCTGHSLSGAMLSSLAIGFLNYLVYSKEYKQVGEVLDELDKKWIETFKHDEEENVNNDWLEVSLIAYNPNTKKFQFSSAKRKMLLQTAIETKILNGNNYPIGGWQIEKNRKYSTLEFELEKPFSVYLFSDGFQDQFGGPANKRYGFNRLEKLIKSMINKGAREKEQAIKLAFDEWKGKAEQTDDVCLLAVEFN